MFNKSVVLCLGLTAGPVPIPFSTIMPGSPSSGFWCKTLQSADLTPWPNPVSMPVENTDTWSVALLITAPACSLNPPFINNNGGN